MAGCNSCMGCLCQACVGVCMWVSVCMLSQLSLSHCLTTLDGWAGPDFSVPRPCSLWDFAAQQTIQISHPEADPKPEEDRAQLHRHLVTGCDPSQLVWTEYF